MPRTRILATIGGALSLVLAYACGGGDPVGAPISVDTLSRDAGGTVSGDGAAATDSAAADSGVRVARSMVAVGGAFACVLAKDGTVSCWGRNDVGQLGRDPAATPSCGSFPCSPTPTTVQGLTNIVRLALGDDFGCALDASRSVWCWGSNAKGQLEASGAGSTSFTPRKLIVDVIDLVATGSHACVLTTENVVRCWGENACEIFGKGAGAIINVARIVPGVPKMAQISVGPDAMCGVNATNGRVFCWGADHRGSLGHDLDTGAPLCGGFPSDPTPKSVQAEADELPIANIADVHMGSGVACARQTDGKVMCWGDNSHGALGQGTADVNPHTRAIDVPAVFAKTLDLHGETPCAIVANRLLCWGDGRSGQVESLAPNPTCGGQVCKALGSAITNMMPVHDVSAGAGSIATIKDDLTVWMWGRNSSAELGIPLSDPNNLACPGGTCIPQPRPVAGIPGLN